MSVPSLTVYANGGPGVSGDNLNTFEQTCDNTAQLRAFIGVQGVQTYLRGRATPNDGYQGAFYWNALATAPDDNGVTTVVPNGSGTGAWTRIKAFNNTYTYVVPLTGFNIIAATGTASLILNPAGSLASGTVTFPASPLDGQLFRISCSQNITALTLSPSSGQSVKNAPTALTAGSGYDFQYVLPQLTWFRLY